MIRMSQIEEKLDSLDAKTDNLQHQIDSIQREDAIFRSYVNRQFEYIFENMATKEDIRHLRYDMSTLDVKLVALTDIVIKIAQKVGVSA